MNTSLFFSLLLILFIAVGCTQIPLEANEPEENLLSYKKMRDALPLDNFLGYNSTGIEDKSYLWQDSIQIISVGRSYANDIHNISVTITDTRKIPAFTLGWEDRKEKNKTATQVIKKDFRGNPFWIEYSNEFQEGYGETLIDEQLLITIKATSPTTLEELELFMHTVNVQYIEMVKK